MSKETVYDSEIYPLMDKIIEICKRDNIALIASFCLSEREDETLLCTTALLTDTFDPARPQLEAYEKLKPRPSFAFAETTTTKPDGSKHISIKRIS